MPEICDQFLQTACPSDLMNAMPSGLRCALREIVIFLTVHNVQRVYASKCSEINHFAEAWMVWWGCVGQRSQRCIKWDSCVCHNNHHYMLVIWITAVAGEDCWGFLIKLLAFQFSCLLFYTPINENNSLNEEKFIILGDQIEHFSFYKITA